MKKGSISLIIIMISIALFACYHIYYQYVDYGSDNLVRDYYDKESTIVKVEKINSEVHEKYLGIIKIPKINLEKGFYNIDSKNNDINKNVTILKESVMPNINGSIIYLIAHSGTGYHAFFKDIDKLTINDIINLDINNNSYQYIVNDIYEMDKNGKIMVNHNIHDNYLVLTTCSKNKDKQLIIVSKMVNKSI